MSTIFDFNTKRIKVLPPTLLVDLNKLIIKYKKDVQNSKINPTEYTGFDVIKTGEKGFIE
jgi:hypothetical protein